MWHDYHVKIACVSVREWPTRTQVLAHFLRTYPSMRTRYGELMNYSATRSSTTHVRGARLLDLSVMP